jgi:hypothetical protein
VYAAVKTRFDSRAVVVPAADGVQVITAEKRYALRSDAGWERVKQSAARLGLDESLVRDIGSEFGVEALAWRRRCDFEATEPDYRDAVAAACIYPAPYSAGCPKGEVEGHGYDLNGAYWAGPQKSEYYVRYGIPGGQAIALRNPPKDILQRTGFILADVEPLHPYVSLQMRPRRGWISTMRLQSWVDRGWAQVRSLDQAIVYATRHPDALATALCESGDKKDQKVWGREVIGRLVAKRHDGGTYLTHDNCEAASLCATLQAAGKLKSVRRVNAAGYTDAQIRAALREVLGEDDSAEAIEEALRGLSPEYPARPEEEPNDPEGIWEIGVEEPGATPSGCYHAHAYFLDYAATLLEGQLAKYAWSDVARVYTDCILLKRGADYGQIDEGAELGQWKREERVRSDSSDRYAESYPLHEERPVPFVAEERLVDWWAPLADQLHVVEGPAGYGKTHKCMEAVPSALVLAPTHKLRRKAAASGHKAMTWQYALWPGKAFDELKVRLPRGRVIFLTEVWTIPKDKLVVMLEYLERKGFRVLMDGDVRQMRPYQGEFADKWLREQIAAKRFGYTWWAEKDWRSQNEETATAKMEMRSKSNFEALWQLRDMGRAMTYEEFLAHWHPRDTVLATVHALRDRIHQDLAAVHQERFPAEKKRIRYGHGARMAGGKSAPRERVGDEEIALSAEVPQGAELAYSVTFSSCQGDTIEAPARVWMFDYHLGAHYAAAVYVGFTRVQALEQAFVVNPPSDLMPEQAEDD